MIAPRSRSLPGLALAVTYRQLETAANSDRDQPLLSNCRAERDDLLSISSEMFKRHALAFLQNHINVFPGRRRPPETPSRRNPGSPGEIIENRSTRSDPGIVGYVEALAASAKGNHFDMAKISTGSSACVLSNSRIAEIDEHTSKRSPLR